MQIKFCGWLGRVALMVVLSASMAQAEGRLVVHGEGGVVAVPDMAELRLGVVEEAGRAQPAISGAVSKAAAMLDRLETLGVASQDVMTGTVALTPVYANYNSGQSPQIEGYRANYRITVRLRDLTTMGAVLDGVLASGANQMDSLQLTVSEPRPFQEAAERAAVQDAMARAERLAEAAGLALGEVLELRVEHAAAPRPMMIQARALSSEMAIAPGESEITARVIMEFALTNE